MTYWQNPRLTVFRKTVETVLDPRLGCKITVRTVLFHSNQKLSFNCIYFFNYWSILCWCVSFSSCRPSSSLSSLFMNDFWGIPLQSNDSHKSYRPITVLTFRWNYLVGGLNPIGYHVINILLHSAVSVLFHHVCSRIFHGYLSSQTSSLSLLCGLFFALHPIHTEAVANVVGRADVLCGLFYLLAFLSYINCFPNGTSPDGNKRPSKYSKLWLASCIFWCILSLFSKEHGVTVLGVCVVFDVLFVCKFNGEHLFKALASPGALLR